MKSDQPSTQATGSVRCALLRAILSDQGRQWPSHDIDDDEAERLTRLWYNEEYQDIRVTCKVDGVEVKGMTMECNALRHNGSTVRIGDQRMSRDLVQKLRFSEPVSRWLQDCRLFSLILLITLPPSRFLLTKTTIELRFDRCRRVFRQARDERFVEGKVYFLSRTSRTCDF
jgi:hypothetical protein